MPAVESELPSGTEAAPEARRILSAALAGRYDPDLLDDANLVLTELVTNAVLHGKSPFRVRVEPFERVLRLQVADAGRTLPLRPQTGPDAMTGRGLGLVAALSTGWGVDPRPGGGKVVWAELSPAGAPAGRARPPGRDFPSDAAVEARSDGADAPGEVLYTVRLGAVPTDLLLAAKSHIDNIVREFTLAAGTSTGGGPRRESTRLIRAVTQGFASARADIKRQALEALRRGDVETELVLTQPASAADAGEEYLAALEEADRYARAARLLTLETPLLHRLFRRWYVQALVDQIRAQATGAPGPPPRTLLQVLAEQVAGTHGNELEGRFGAVFEQLPTPYLLMDTDLVIVAANDAYLTLLGRTRAEVLGLPVFQAFPPAPDRLDAQGRNPLEVSFLRARDTGRPDQLPLFSYAVIDPDTGESVPRHWSLISAPVLGPGGGTELVLQRVEDVTDYVEARLSEQDRAGRNEQWQQRVDAVEADLFARVRELQVARDAEEVANRRLSALVEVALHAARAETVPELAEVILGQGLSALQADGGAIAVRHDDVGLRIVGSAGLRDGVLTVHDVVRLDAPLPSAAVTRTGERLLFSRREEVLSWNSAMGPVLEASGCPAWAFLPLRAEGRVLGALCVGWSSPHAFDRAEIDVLEALAAQCACGLERLQTRQVEREAADVAQRMSAALQRSLLSAPPQPDHLQIVVRYRPASRLSQVGGDWYDALLTESGITSLVIGDVTGHNLEAVAEMGQLRSMLRGIAYAVEQPPAAVLSTLDRALRQLGAVNLATAVLAQVHQDPVDEAAGSRRRLRWSNAGHPPPLLVSRDGQVTLLAAEPDLLLGLDADTPRGTHEVVLYPGDTVLLYTDGLIERRGASLDDGFAWLTGAAEGLAGGDLEEACDGLLATVAPGVEDDIALLALRVRAPDGTGDVQQDG
ncbi:MAG: Sensor phosphatase [Frankiales bacterium]|nr:Sensor phosphatase [Frankiales bacterium]